MGVRFPSGGSIALVNNQLNTNVETVVCVTPPLILPLDFAQVLIFWYFVVTTAAGTTAIQPKIKRGPNAASTTINPGLGVTAAAAAVVSLSGVYVDTPGAVAGQQYALTMTAIGAGANANISDACIIAFAL